MVTKNEDQAPFPRVAEFYNGKSVFMTGATGYLGVLILETLLELCPGIKNIYILLRAKEGVSEAQRLNTIFDKQVFDKVKHDMPEVLDKVQVVSGDISKPDFGMREEDLQKIVENASIVFHIAASMNFLKPLKYILQHNVMSTQYTIDICRKLNNLDALVYTSSIYGNSNRKSTIKEEIYRVPFHAQRFLDEISNGTDGSLDQLVAECQPPWPKSYTFSKVLAENVLQDNASDLPVIIVRPSFIVNIWKRPLPGYGKETGGLTALSLGIGKGFLKVLHGDPNNCFDFIPGDITASTHLIAAWSVATNRSPQLHVINCASITIPSLTDYSETMLEMAKRWPVPKSFRKPTNVRIIKNNFLYNMMIFFEHCVPAYAFDALLKLSGSKMRETMLEMAKRWPVPKSFRKPTNVRIIKNNFLYNMMTFYEHCVPAYAFDVLLKLSGSKMRETMLEMAKRWPVPKSFRKPTNVRIIKNNFLYNMMTFYEHCVPAYAFDVLLKLSGSKMRVVPIYDIIHKANKALKCFMAYSWTFNKENFHNLIKQLHKEDIKMFELDELTSSVSDLAYLLPKGAPFYHWSLDKKSPEKRMKSMVQRLWLTNIIKAVFLLAVAGILYLLLSIVLVFFR